MKIRTEYTTDYSEPSACFPNVARLVADRGGRAVFGWFPCRPLNGNDLQGFIHHCVWESPEGELIDITPQITILTDDYHAFELAEEVEFVCDDSATLVDGRTRPPRYEPLRPEFAKAAQYIVQSECKALTGDLAGANYWTWRANAELAKHHKGRSFKGWEPYTPTTFGMMAV